MKMRFYLFINKEETEILLNALNILKELNDLPEKKEILDNLINRIYESIQSHLNENLINRKEVFNKDYLDSIYNELISLFNRAKEPITISINENIKYANSAFCKMLGYESENEIIELGLFNMISKRCLPIIKNFYKKRSKGEIVPNIHDLELKRADGSTILIECIHYCMPFKELNLMITFYIGLTKLKSLEKKLRESEERLQNFMASSPDSFTILDSELNYLIVNEAGLKAFGKTEKEIIGKNVLDLNPTLKDTDRYYKYLEVIKTGKPYSMDDFIPHPRFGDLHLNVRVFKVGTGLGVIVTDITAHKKAEEDLRIKDRAIESSLSGIAITDMMGKIKYVNPSFLKMWGYNDDKEILGRSGVEFWYKEGKAEEALQAIQEKRVWSGDLVAKRKDGTHLDIQVKANAILDEKRGIEGIIASFVDLTERKKIEEELRLHSEIMTNMAEGVYLIRTNDGIITYTNPKFEKMFGYKQGEMIGKNVSIVNAPTDKDPRETAKEIMEILERTGEWHGEVKNIKKDGTPFWCYANVSTFDHPEHGRVWVSVHTDITERKRAEQKLKENEAWLSTTLSSIGDAVIATDRLGNVQFLNPIAESLTGWKQEESIGKPLEDIFNIINAETRKSVENPVLRVIREGIVIGLANHTVLITRSGKEIPIADSGAPIKDDKGNIIGVVLIFRDIRERKKAEQKLKESEKKYRKAYNQANFYKDLFAHDINNILNNIKSSAELISLFLKNSENLKDSKEFLDIIKDQVTRGAKLISNVRKLSQLEEGEISIKIMDVCKVLNEAKEFLKKSFITRNINIHIDFIREKHFVQANDLLFDIFENVLNNAVKYNVNSTIEIFVRISKSQKEKIKYLKIEFIDNGIGIPDVRKETIFQRAYTKDISKRGMGFGLSLVKKIIESYKGEIWIEDNVKGDRTKGSNFVLLIPEVV